jgi:adenylosuccinate synthase
VGDEGKGKIVDVLTSKYDIIARFQEVQCRTYLRI